MSEKNLDNTCMKDKLEKIVFDDTLTDDERNAIDVLVGDDVPPEILHTALTQSTLNVWTKDEPIKKTMAEIIQAFDEHVEESDWRRLSLKNKGSDPDTNTTNEPPLWLSTIIDQPKGSDLAYFVQNLSAFLQYTVKKWYGEDADMKVTVTADKIFGKQTKRALSWLKAWVDQKNLNPDTTSRTLDATTPFFTKKMLDQYLNNKSTDEKNKILALLHLLEDNSWSLVPEEWYIFVDQYWTNLRVRKSWDVDSAKAPPPSSPSPPPSSSSPDCDVSSWWSEWCVNESTDNDTTDPETANDAQKTANDAQEAPKNAQEAVKPIWSKLYDSLYKDFISSLVALSPDQQAWFKIWLKAKSNPYVELTFSKYDSTVLKSFTNTRKYLLDKDSANPAWQKALKERVIKDIRQMNAVVQASIQEIQQQRAIDQKLREGLTSIQWKRYTLKELFPDKVDDRSYQLFFKTFSDNTLEIDKSPSYTRLDNDTLYLHFDQRWRDSRYVYNLTIPKEKLFSSNGSLKNNSLKHEIALLVKAIVENPDNGYV